MAPALPKLPLHVDVVFRRLFDQPRLLCSLLNAILGFGPSCARRIVDLSLLPTQVHGPLAGDKEVVLDLRATCADGRQFHIELQVRPYPFYVERSLFYWSGMYHGQLPAGQGYDDLRAVVSIHILHFALLPDDEGIEYPHNVFELCNRRSGRPLSEHMQLHTIEIGKFAKAIEELSTEEDFWLYFIKHGHKLPGQQIEQLKVPEIKEAEEKLRVISQDRELRMLYEQRQKAERDKAAAERDWTAYGKRLGLDEGKRLGLDEGKRLGLDEGKRAEACDAILDLCEVLGIAVPAAAQDELTQLDLPQLHALRDAIKTRRSWPG